MRTSVDSVVDPSDRLQSRVQVIRLTDEQAEFITKAGHWVELTRIAAGFRLRVYRYGQVAQQDTHSINAALEAARDMVGR